MYVKLFESRQSFNYYIIEHHISIKGIEHDQLVIGNQEKKKKEKKKQPRRKKIKKK